MQKKIAALIAIASTMAGASAAMAQGRGPDTASAVRISSPASSLFAGFGEDERRLITDWFHDSNNVNTLPPALAKQERLAPALQKQLTRNATLPLGLERKSQPLPRALETRLPRLPAGRRRVVVGGNVILLDESTSMIVDIIPSVL
jgi:hypothetical protein